MSKGRTVPPQPQRLAPGLHLLEYKHDSWCKTLKTQRLDDCTCQPDIELVSYNELQRRAQKGGAQ